MFRNKSDVDKRVSALLYNAKNEHERNLRCYNIALLYYKAHDFESAQRYATMYLSVRDDSAAAHKLLGQAYEKLGKKDKAIASYSKSLKLESDQSDLILKICELLIDKDVEFDPQLARYWSDRASLLFPHSTPVFMLKEKLMMSDSSLASEDLEELLHAELKTKPTDMNVRIKLLKLYAESGRVELALNHAFEVEARQSHSSLMWYQCINDICKVYNRDNPAKCNWEFYLQWISALDRMCSFCISETSSIFDISEVTDCIYNLDQTIYQAKQSLKGPEIFKEFSKYISSQLAFYLAILLLKKAKKDTFWKETKKLVSPLFFLALSPPPVCDGSWSISIKDSFKKLLNSWVHHSNCRIVQAGYVLLSLSKENHSEKMFIDKVSHFISSDWRTQIFEKCYHGIKQINASNSHFMTGVEFSKVLLKMPSNNSFKSSLYVSSFENVYFGSLHHLVWLGLQQLKKTSISEIKLPSFRTTCFKSLQFTISNLNNIGVETINQLDIDSFLYATVFCAAAVLENHKSNGYLTEERLQVLPAVISAHLCTSEQSKWWLHVCSLVRGGLFSEISSSENISDLRFTLQRGLEVIRGEGLPPLLIVAIARTFASRALISEISEESEGCQARALHLWKLVYPILESFALNKSLITPSKKNSFFDYPVRDLNSQDAKKLLEEAKFFIGCHYMNTNQFEKAIEEFKTLKSPQAIFNLAMVYHKWAEVQVEDLRGEEITSEIRCRHVVLASKAREYLVKVKTLIRNDSKHPLYSSIEAKLLDIDEMLARIEPENSTSERDANGTLDGSISGGSGGTPAFADLNMMMSSTHRNRMHHTSTPRRIQEQKTNNFNMSELIDLLSVQHTTNQLKMQQVLEQVRLIVDKVENSTSEQRSLIDGLTNRLNNFETEIKNNIADIRKDIKRPDICNMFEEDDYTDEMLQYQNYSQYYQHPQRAVQNSAAAIPYGNQYFSPRLDPLYQGNISFYNQGALQFSEGQQLPDFLRTIPPGSQKLPQPLLHQSGVQAPFGHIANVPGASKTPVHTNVIPNNLVLPTEPLPPAPHQPHPPLSVTIPPLSNKSSAIPGVPHNFQIPLPPQPKPTLNIEERVEEETPPPAYDPLPDFKPLVPLPKEIEVSTGEEGEEILFERKAKLFRFVDSEWKERGIGILKILKHKVTGKYRIVMRREQIHKICANHFITADINLDPKANADKAWIWVANDFADEEMRVEKFCARFKTPEDSAEFKKVFDDVKKELQNSKGSSVETNSGTESNNKKIVPISSPQSTGFGSSTVTSYAPSNTLFKFPAAAQNLNSSSNKPFMLSGSDENNVQTAVPSSKSNIGGFSFSLSQPKLKLPEEPKETKVETSKEPNPFSKFSFGTSATVQGNANTGSIFGGKGSGVFGIDKSNSVFELKKSFGDKTEAKENVFSLNFQKTDDEKSKKSVENLQNEATKNFESKTLQPLSSIVKTVPGSWECKSCYVRNKSEVQQCEACGNKKPGSSVDAKPENNKFITPNEANKTSQNLASVLSTEKPSLSTLLKPAPGSWECQDCYLRNTSDKQTCSSCSSKKPGGPVDPKPEISKFGSLNEEKIISGLDQKSVTNSNNEQPTLASLLKPSPGSWECKSCYIRNGSDKNACAACGENKPGSIVDTSVKNNTGPGFVFGGPSQPTTDSPKFSFGSSTTFSFPSSSTFSFNASTMKSNIETPSTVSSQKPDFGFTFPPSSETVSQFTFGKKSFQFTMPEVKPTSPSVNKSLDESHDSEPEEEEDHLQFQPVIPLPDKITVVTGEENETVLYCKRAKLFRYDSSAKEWKERGVGDVKILKHNITGKIRFLMRRDQVMKICLNHLITDEITLKPKDDKTWLWYAVDYSEGVETKESFAIRFKSPEIAKEFKEAFDNALVKDSSISTSVEGTSIHKQGEKSTNLEVVQDANVSNSDSDIEITYEQKAPPELVEKALALKLPSNFYCYLEKPPCPGCPGCEADDEEEKDDIGGNKAKDPDAKETEIQNSQQPNKEINQGTVENKSPVTFGFNPNASSVEKFSFASALKTNEPQNKTVGDNSSRYFFNNDSSFSNPNPVNSIFGSDKSTGVPFGGGGGGEAFSFKSIAETSSVPVNNETMPFTAFAQAAKSFSFGGQNENFKWEGAGSQLFADIKNKAPADDEDEGDSDNGRADDDHDPQFAPIVPLPDKIELKTGEEDEDVVFSERGLLYRFDNKEWKQRGTGDMKILKHKTKNIYRLVMRREQVYKLVCNHLIPADFELKPKTDKAFCWSALNYCPEKSDDKPVSENLCIKFKDEKLALKFKTAIEDCLKSLREDSST